MGVKARIRYLPKFLSFAAIVTALSQIAFANELGDLGEKDLAVLAALKRSCNGLKNATLSEIQDYLRTFDAQQALGLVSNVKGILHEMEFVRLENEDGDSIYASLFDTTNHPDTDVQLLDTATNETWDVQLKATDSEYYVQDWIDHHPDGEILVSSELAEEMDLPTSGLSNDELTADVEDFVDRMTEADGTEHFWHHIPALRIASLAWVVWTLYQRYEHGEIDWNHFRYLSAKATGLRLARIGIIGLLLGIPVVGQITGAALVAKLLVGLSKSNLQT